MALDVLRILILACAMLSGCGRLAFDERHAATSDAASDVAADAAPGPPPMFVQGTLAQVTTNPQTLAFPTDPMPGALLVVAVGALSMVTTVTDSRGDTFANAIAFDNTASMSSGFVYDAIAAGGLTTVTITYASATTQRWS